MTQTRLIPATRREQFRVRAADRDGSPAVRVDLLQPIASHSDAMAVAGQALIFPAERVGELVEALELAATEALQAAAAPPERHRPIVAPTTTVPGAVPANPSPGRERGRYAPSDEF